MPLDLYKLAEIVDLRKQRFPQEGLEKSSKLKTLLNSFHFLWSYCGMLHLAKGYKILWLKFKKKKYVYLRILRKKTLAILGPKCTLLEDVIFKLWTIEIHAKAPFLWGFSPSLYTCRSHSFEMLIFSHDALGWQKDKLTALKCQLSWQAHSISMQCLHSTV